MAVVGVACSGDDPPALGASAGEVSLSIKAEPTPGGTVVVDVESGTDGSVTGGLCFTIERWSGGQWSTEYVVDSGSDTVAPVADEEWSCPAMGRTLPATFEVAMPQTLDDGTWRLSYGWHRGGERGAPATFTFEVDSP